MVGGGRGGPGNGGMNMNDGNVGGSGGGGWGPSPAKPNPGQWGGNSNPTSGPRGGPSNSWDLESPNMQRRGGDGVGRGGPPRDVGQGGGGSTDDGTSHWGFKPPPQPSAAPGPAGKIFFL